MVTFEKQVRQDCADTLLQSDESQLRADSEFPARLCPECTSREMLWGQKCVSTIWSLHRQEHCGESLHRRVSRHSRPEF